MGTVKHAAETLAKADQDATHEAAKARNTPVMKAVAAISELADQPPLIAVSLGTLAVGIASGRLDLARGGARMLFAHLLATGMKSAIKHQFDRTRPEQAIEHGGHHFSHSDEGGHEDKSFPSGHTAGAVAVALAASRDIEGVAVPAGVAAAAVAAAQPPTGHHYVTDVLAGAVVGWAAEAVVSRVFDRFEPKVEAALTPPLQGEGDRRAQPGGGGVTTPD